MLLSEIEFSILVHDCNASRTTKCLNPTESTQQRKGVFSKLHCKINFASYARRTITSRASVVAPCTVLWAVQVQNWKYPF
jgi:hypothetical protein